jgi:signal transduction histidine kinase/ActR/RegA family two-component response regulator
MTPLAMEIARQHGILRRELPQRVALTWVAFLLAALFADPRIVISLGFADMLAELGSARLMAGLDPALQPRRYRSTLALVVVMEGCFCLAAGLVWQDENPFAKALAAGMVMTTLLQLSTVRAIHLPYGMAGISTVAAVTLCSNLVFWIGMGEWTGLVISTLAAAGGISYATVAMLSNHALHRQSAEGQASARAADAEKSRLLATISHELRTPLNGILGMGHAALAEATTPEAKARLSVLVASAEGLSAILDDILDFSAAREGRLAIRPSIGLPGDEIAAAVTLFRHAAPDRGEDVTLHLAPGLDQPARFDRLRLRQCLSNLLSNALRHGQGAAVRVSARRLALAPGAAMLEVTVCDDGPGVSADLRDTLFEPFARSLPPEGEPARPGQGLGLSVTRALARLMGGDVALLPPMGRGAAFRLTLPLGAAAEGVTAEAPAPSRSQPCRVLVVDDIATNRMVAISCLQLAGATGIGADCGAEALRLLEQERFDAVFLDMNMPGLDGLATLARIRALPVPAARVRVVAMTADAGAAKRDHYLSAGCDGYLAKPVTPERIAAVVAETVPAAPQA